MLTVTLIEMIDAWCARTGQSEGLIGAAVMNHPGFAPQLRSRGTLKPETAAKAVAFMAAFPDKGSLPFEIVQELKRSAREGRPWKPAAPVASPVVPATEAKPRIPAAVIKAAAMDGRDLGTFVSALILMGLDVWRDDRAAHGEAI